MREQNPQTTETDLKHSVRAAVVFEISDLIESGMKILNSDPYRS